MIKFIICLILTIIGSNAHAIGETRFKDIIVSNKVAVGTSQPAASSAILDINSTTKGILGPRMTSTQRDAISSPAAGLSIYNTSTNKYNFFNTAWQEAVNASDAQTITNKTINGSNNTFINLPIATASSGQLPLANGGTNANLTAVAGGAVYSTGSALGITAAGSSGDLHISNGAAAPIWVNRGSLSDQYWTRSGNSGTVFQTDYLGTSDAASMAIKTNGITRIAVSASGLVGIGTTAPAASLDVKGSVRFSGATSGSVTFVAPAVASAAAYTLPSADGTSSQVLTTNGSGILSWASPAAGALKTIVLTFGGTGSMASPTACTGTCTIYGNTGEWTGVVRNSIGNYTATMTGGTFTTLIGCVLGIHAIVTDEIHDTRWTFPSATTIQMVSGDVSSNPKDSSLVLTCWGN